MDLGVDYRPSSPLQDLGLCGLTWKNEAERRSLRHSIAVRGNAPPMCLDDGFHNRQTQACAAGISAAGLVGALEAIENEFKLVWFQAQFSRSPDHRPRLECAAT